MSGRTWVISDTHFGHVGVTQFLRADSTKLRPWDNVEEMDEAMVANWNLVVAPEDRVYHLGDVVINRRHLKTLERLNGRKCLIKGNHDIFKLQDYLPYFDDIRAYHIVKNGDKRIIMSHIPVYEGQLHNRFSHNIHGHLHSNLVMVKDQWGREKPDRRYINVSVEQINYTPKLLQELLKEHDVLQTQRSEQILGT